jgi:3(or 17)beta-hydroxysteroid dehydrogenase
MTASKTALVTGGASGIGEAIARKLHAHNWCVVVADLNLTAGHALVDELGDGAHCYPLDVTSETQWQTLMGGLAQEGITLDLLVNNAGIGAMASIEETDVTLWQQIQAVNATGVFLGCKMGLTHLPKSPSSSIVNIASALGKRALAGTCAYSASKAAAISLTESTALQSAQQGYGIRCNAILPGFIETPLLLGSIAASEDPAALEAYFTGLHPAGRIGKSEEVAAAVMYLASDDAGFITGISLSVDGGMTL